MLGAMFVFGVTEADPDADADAEVDVEAGFQSFEVLWLSDCVEIAF